MTQWIKAILLIAKILIKSSDHFLPYKKERLKAQGKEKGSDFCVFKASFRSISSLQ